MSFFLEQVRGIEPPCSAWEADILPLNYTCMGFSLYNIPQLGVQCKGKIQTHKSFFRPAGPAPPPPPPQLGRRGARRWPQAVKSRDIGRTSAEDPHTSAAAWLVKRRDKPFRTRSIIMETARLMAVKTAGRSGDWSPGLSVRARR